MSDMKIKVILEEANVNKDFFTSNRKENNLKCPFCQQELKCWDEPQDAIYSNWSCPNCRRFAYGNKLIWQELIRTRKALDVALDKLKRIQKIYTSAPFNAPIDYANVCTDMYDVATEQIKELDND